MRVLSFIEKFILSLCLILLISLIPTPSSGMTRFIYDDLGRLATVSDDNGESVIYGYDSVGNLLSITGNAEVQAPQVKSITPSSASQGDILTVTITGDNLAGVEIETNNSGITVGSVNTSRRSVSATFSISYQAVTGMSTVTVKTPLGYATAGFTVEPTPPVVTDLSPSSGPVSRLVTMTGNGFSAVPTENTVSFNGTVSPVITAGITSILTSVPAGAATGPVTVTVNGLTSKGINFTVLSSRPPPVIASITPNAGSVDGGTLVTVAGSGFTSDTKVLIGGRNPLTLQIVDASTITFKTPPGPEGPANVLVTNVNGDAFLPGGFTYLPGPNESILRINPPLGRIDTPVNTDISIIFTGSVDRRTVTESSFMVLDNETDTPVAGDISFDFGDRSVFFRPLLLLNQNTTYRISISQEIRSSDGIPLDAPFTGFFTTGAAADTISPAVTTSPADGETVPYNSSIVFTFSEPMNLITLNDYMISARTSFRGFSARTSLTLHFKKISRGPSCY
ncbi:MAG TPA: hypothetical protein ENI58_02095, partial [Nitrospirae bacterium]|nr:hypothetical protein [Nitrospirota bacterium]